MATLTVQEIDLSSGLVPTYASAAAGGDEFANEGITFAHIKNGGGSSITVTVTPVATPIDAVQFGRIVPAARTFTVANGSERMLPFFSAGGYNNASGRVALAYSAVTDVTVAAIRAPKAQ